MLQASETAQSWAHIMGGLTAVCQSVAEALTYQEVEEAALKLMFPDNSLPRLLAIAQACGCEHLVLAVAEALPQLEASEQLHQRCCLAAVSMAAIAAQLKG